MSFTITMCPGKQEFAAKGSFIQYGGVVDHALVVRGITTVYNTDYMTDFVFHLNGAIKARRFHGVFQYNWTFHKLDGCMRIFT